MFIQCFQPRHDLMSIAADQQNKHAGKAQSRLVLAMLPQRCSGDAAAYRVTPFPGFCFQAYSMLIPASNFS